MEKDHLFVWFAWWWVRFANIHCACFMWIVDCARGGHISTSDAGSFVSSVEWTKAAKTVFRISAFSLASFGHIKEEVIEMEEERTLRPIRTNAWQSLQIKVGWEKKNNHKNRIETNFRRWKDRAGGRQAVYCSAKIYFRFAFISLRHIECGAFSHDMYFRRFVFTIMIMLFPIIVNLVECVIVGTDNIVRFQNVRFDGIVLFVWRVWAWRIHNKTKYTFIRIVRPASSNKNVRCECDVDSTAGPLFIDQPTGYLPRIASSTCIWRFLQNHFESVLVGTRNTMRKHFSSSFCCGHTQVVSR